MPRTDWSLVAAPAAAAQATATRAAGAAGVRHYLQKLQVGVAAAAGAVVAPIYAHVRDGAAGAGAIMWSGALAAVLTTSRQLDVEFDPPIIGTAATAMTIEFTGASAAGSIQTVCGQGYDL